MDKSLSYARKSIHIFSTLHIQHPFAPLGQQQKKPLNSANKLQPTTLKELWINPAVGMRRPPGVHHLLVSNKCETYSLVSEGIEFTDFI